MKKLCFTLLIICLFSEVYAQCSVTGGTITGPSALCTAGSLPIPPLPTAPLSLSEIEPAGPSDGSLSYQWESSTDGIDFQAIANATEQNYAGQKPTAPSTYYRRVTTGTVDGTTCSAYSNTHLVVLNLVDVGFIPSQTICGNDPELFIETTPSSNEGLTFQWKSSKDLLSWTTIPGAINSSYDAGPIFVTTYFKREVTRTYNDVTCTGSNLVTVTLNKVTAGAIGEGSAIVCRNGDPAIFTNATLPTGNLFSTQWQSSIDNGATWNDIQNANLLIYDPPAIPQTTQYRRLSSSTVNDVTCTVSSNVKTVIVNGPGEIAGNQAVCGNEDPVPFTEIAPAQGSGLMYFWEKSTNNGSYSPVEPAVSSATYDPPIQAQTTYYRRLARTVIPGAGNCHEYSAPVVVTFKAVPAILNNNKTICSGSPTDIGLTSGLSGTTYEWLVQSKSSTVAGVVAGDNGNAEIINHVLTNSATAAYGTVVYRITPASNGCIGNFKDVTVTVNSLPTAGAVASSQTICAGANPALFTQTTASTGYGTIGWQWQISTDNLSYNDIGGATSVTFDEATSLAQTTYYRRMTKSTQNGITCSVSSAPIVISMGPSPPGSITQVGKLCESVVVTLKAGGSTDYNWSTGAHTRNIDVYFPGYYSVNYKNQSGCYVTAGIEVQLAGEICNVTSSVSGASAGLNLYPNPVIHSNVTVTLLEPAKMDTQVSILSQVGEEVGSSVIQKDQTNTTLTLNNVPNGIYTLILRSQKGVEVQRRIAVSH